jgi:hypothetical protein
MKKIYEINYKDFYTDLLSFSEKNPQTYIGKEYLTIKNNLIKILKNERHWGDVIPNVGDINWEVDEASCIRLVENKDIFYNEISQYLANKYETDEHVLRDIINYQKARLHHPFKEYPIYKYFNFNIHDVIENNKSIKEVKNVLTFTGKNYNNLYEWAKNTLWFGRRIARYKTKVI